MVRAHTLGDCLDGGSACIVAGSDGAECLLMTLSDS
jgi:hypothetical protein